MRDNRRRLPRGPPLYRKVTTQLPPAVAKDPPTTLCRRVPTSKLFCAVLCPEVCYIRVVVFVFFCVFPCSGCSNDLAWCELCVSLRFSYHLR